MSPKDEGGPPEPPDYKVYRSRRGPSIGKPDLASLRDRLRRGRPSEPAAPKPLSEPEERRRPWVRWIGLALLGWFLLSVVAFAVSAQIQKSKLADTGDALGGNPLLAAFPQNILVIGTDVRSSEFADTEAQSDECVEQASTGATPDACTSGARADTLMIVRAGGGVFEKLSIPRDVYADVPGQGAQKINGAYTFGGAKLQIETVEQLLGIEINHVAIVDFAGFRDFIDAIGGVKVTLDRPVCNSISGGTFNINFDAGEVTLNGEKALALARTRTSTCGDEALDDLDRAKFQQQILQGIKDRLTDPLRIPRNFLFGPLIGWNAPKALVSDMGALTMPQLALAAAIGGSSETEVLKPSGAGPGGSLIVPVESCVKAVEKLTGERPEREPLCSPTG
jgi:LCP family protein required for cell wall assembly